MANRRQTRHWGDKLDELGVNSEADTPDGDRCPTTGEEECARCSGEYCDVHGTEPCNCDTAERHRTEG